MISQSTIEEIKERANLVEIVGESVQLKRNGANYTGICPFHSEKTPSFHIRDNGRFYHCFGCGVSGNVITYVMESRGLSFPDAVEELAARYGIEVKHEGGAVKRDDAPHKDVFYTINKIAFEFYQKNLASADAAVGSYLRSRHISPKSIAEFGVGFAPKQWGALCEHLKKEKFDDELLLQSGLVRRSPKGDLYDTFRARIIFPIVIEARKIAGFGGRIVPGLLDEASLKSAPKYLNSPETAVYQKGKIFYGFPQALESLRRSKELYLVEGYMDVIGLWQAGVRNVLATCGTAVSENHVKRLQHLVERVAVLFDGDVAGRAAAAKCFATFLNSGIDVSALFLPEDEDPDTIAIRYGEKTSEYLSGLDKVPLLDCFIDSLVLKTGLKEMSELGAAAKGKIAEEVAGLLSKVRNTIEQGDLLQRAALKLGVGPAQLGPLVEKAAGNIKTETAVKALPIDESQRRGPVAIEDLPRVDRELLHVVMVKRGELSAELLRDADVCEGVHPATLRFIQGMEVILSNAGAGEEAKRDHIKALLKEFGDSWVSHWRKSYQMLTEKEVDFDRALIECRGHLKKTKLKRAIMDVDQRMASSDDEQEKGFLALEKIQLKRRLEQV